VDEETRAEIKEAIEAAMKSKPAPTKTVYDYAMEVGRTFGASAVILIVLMGIAYQTIPGYVAANIETQKSLTKNLDLQTENIKKLVPSLEALQEDAVDFEAFRQEVSVDHIAMAKELRVLKLVQVGLAVSQQMQRDEHKAIMETQEGIVTTQSGIVGVLQGITDDLKSRKAATVTVPATP